MDIHVSGDMVFLKNFPSVFMKHCDTTLFLLSRKLHHLDFAPTLPCPAQYPQMTWQCVAGWSINIPLIPKLGIPTAINFDDDDGG